MKHLLTTLAAVLTTLSLSAATYFASPNGQGNGQTYATPCSFDEGVKKLAQPGDTLYLLGGTYMFSNSYSLQKSGSKNQGNIVIAGYPGERPILDFRQVAYGTRGLCLKNSCQYVHVMNMDICYSGKNNLYNEGSYCRFEDLDIYGSGDTGCQMKNGGHNLIINVDSHDNFDYQHYGSNGADFGGNADGFADKQHSGAPNHYIGCRAWNNSDDGWDFFDRKTDGFPNEQTIIEDCICYQNGMPEYNMVGHARYQTDKSWFDDINGTTITNRYGQQQVVTLAHYPNHGNGNGFKLGGNYSKHNVMIHHCLSVANNVKGFDQNNDNGTMRVYNCTGYDNGNNFGFAQTDGSKGGKDVLYIQNCVSYHGRNGDFLNSHQVLLNDHNSWNINLAVSNALFQSTDTTHILEARLVNGDLPQAIFNMFAPANGSALIDAGSNVGLPYGGQAPDLGWREQGPITVYPETPEDPEPPGPTPIVFPEGKKRIALVTQIGCSEDAPIRDALRGMDSVFVVECDATDNEYDYSPFDVIVISPKPSSGAAGLNLLKGINKPVLLLKPWVLKPSVWNWGTAVNTADYRIDVHMTSHPVVANILNPKGNPVFTTDGKISLFTEVNTNGVTGITASSWNNCDTKYVIAKTTDGQTDVIVEFPQGARCNSTTLKQPLLCVGVSEYSTAHLSRDGQQLIANAVYYLLGMQPRFLPEVLDINNMSSTSKAQKIMRNGQIIIIRDQKEYTILGL